MWKKMFWCTALGLGVFLAYKNKECIMDFVDNMFKKISNSVDDMQVDM